MSSKPKNSQKSASTLLVNLISNLTDKLFGFEPQIQKTKLLEKSKLTSVISAELGKDKFKEIIETLIGFEPIRKRATVVAAIEGKQAEKRSAVEIVEKPETKPIENRRRPY